MRINEKKLAAIISLPASQRYSHFVKVAADQRKVWGLWNDGWVLAATNEGTEVFPLWPAPEYASACASEDWSNCQPREIDLDQLFEKYLPGFQKDGILVGVFPTPKCKGIAPSLDRLEQDLRKELSRIE